MDSKPKYYSGNGAIQITLNSWSEFVQHVHQSDGQSETIWRGQRDPKWLLESTLIRLINSVEERRKTIAEFTASHLENFKYSVRGRRGKNPSTEMSVNDWWALGQHHGLATPLLDWTHSPFVAAYFAFHEDQQDDLQYRAIYALHRKTYEQTKLSQTKVATTTEEISTIAQRPYMSFFKPFSDENANLVNQNGLFSKSSHSVEECIQVYQYPNVNVLEQILIPNSERKHVLRILNLMNINHLTLFPDLYGAAKFCNLSQTVINY